MPRSEDVKLNSFEFRRNEVPRELSRELRIEVPMGGESIPGLPQAGEWPSRQTLSHSGCNGVVMLAREVQIFRRELILSSSV